MKITGFSLIAIFFLSVFVGCNKDGDITMENPIPDPPENPLPDNPEIDLPYEVIEYLPAPGQYINDPTTGFNDITTHSAAIAQATKRLQQKLYVSLGAWGGQLTIKFHKPVENTGEFQFSISCNAFDNSSEPGIVWVMQDTNGNNLPDDIWYELKGSHFGKEGYERNYWVTYSRPEADRDTPWLDSNGETGVINRLGSYHSQPFYYPEWVETDSYTLYGSRLPLQVEQNPVTGNWTPYPFDWGYADNFGNDFFEDGFKNIFSIDNAVTEDNQSVKLSSIDFVKIQTAVNGSSGWLGELSTEITGIYIEN